MLLPLLGSMGTGLVWGWLLVQRHRRPSTHRFGQLLALGAATGAVVVLVALLAGSAAVVAFLIATSVALIIHLAWLETLRTRVASIKQPE